MNGVKRTASYRILSALLFTVLLCSLLPLHVLALVVPTGTATTRDEAWIEAADAAIVELKGASDTWKDYLADVFYEAVQYDDSGSLAWADSGLADSLIWNGKEQGDLTPNTGSTIAAQKANANPLDASHTTPAAQQAAADTQPALDGTTYYVYSPQQLLFALRALQKGPLTGLPLTGYTISIENDLDMGGRQGYDWPDDIVLTGRNTLLGNNKTIYNLRVRPLTGDIGDTSYRASGLIRNATTLKANNLTFQNAHVLGVYQAGALVGYFDAIEQVDTQFMELDNISVQDSLIMSYSSTSGAVRSNGAGGIFGRRNITKLPNQNGLNLAAQIGGTIKNCNVQNSIITSLNHTGAVTSALNYMDLATNCFTVGCTVISFGEHSGGMFSCMSGVTEMSNCFVDANVYCKTDGGVFTGAAGNVHIYDCFSSGFVEGTTNLGGFVGSIIQGRNSTIVNCYSTALVGLRSEASALGGFVGNIPNSSAGYNVGLVNCYAAGEVGSASVYVDGEGLHTDRVGGFVGNAGAAATGGTTASAESFTSRRNYAAYCYYDKQTTAMREWNIGSMKDAWQTTGGFTNPTVLNGYVTVGEIGIFGVLTTDTVKAGNGLMSDPEAGSAMSTGFLGFKNMSGFYSLEKLTTTYPAADVIKPKVSNYFGWDYSTVDHYPELAVFSKANTDYASRWGQWADLVAAYSKSSTSGAKLETWEKGLNADTGEKTGIDLQATVYDTVRDLTARFRLTTDPAIQTWHRTQTPTGADNTFAKTTILGVSKDVLVLTDGRAEEMAFYCSSFAPGIEWLKTNVTVNGTTATRRFRVTPTAGVNAGANRIIYPPSEDSSNIDQKIAAFYDHADDVELYFTTAARFAADEPITTGIYPDSGDTENYAADYMSRTANELTERQMQLSNDLLDDTTSTYFQNHGNDTYGGSGGPLGGNTGVDISFMSRDGETAVDSAVRDNNANGSHLFIYFRNVSGISPETGQVVTDGTLMNMTDVLNADTFNGLKLKHLGDKVLLVEYVWQLDDGRLVYDAKLITVKTTPFSATITAYDAGGIDGSTDNRAELDSSNGLRDTNDALVDMLKLRGNNSDAVVSTSVDTTVKAQFAEGDNRTEDILYSSYLDTDGATPLPLDQVGPEYGDTLVASWKVTNPDKVVAKLLVRMDTNYVNTDNTKMYVECTLTNPQPGDVLSIPYQYYRYVTSVGGDFFVNVETRIREYTVKRDGDIFYLVFNKNNPEADMGTDADGNPIDPVEEIDVSNNIEVEIELSPVLEVIKRVTGTLGDQEQEFGFTVELPELPDGNTYDYNIYHADGSAKTEGTVTRGDNTLTMRHGDRLVIIGLPYDTNYTVSETDYLTAGYMTFINDATTAALEVSGTLEVTATSPTDTDGEHTADRTCSYVNSRTPAPNTGVILHNSPFLIMLLLALFGLGMWRLSIKKRRNS